MASAPPGCRRGRALAATVEAGDVGELRRLLDGGASVAWQNPVVRVSTALLAPDCGSACGSGWRAPFVVTFGWPIRHGMRGGQ